MYQLKKEEMYKISSLFDGWEETLLWSCLQGYMGNAWTDDVNNPKSAQIVTADFAFYSGTPNIELVRNIPDYFKEQCLLVVPRDKDWAEFIEQVYSSNNSKFMRYAIKKEPDVFDKDKLHTYIDRLPSEFTLKKIDEDIYHKVQTEEWSKYFCCNYHSYKDYEANGLGYVIFYEGNIVSGASSYTSYDRGIEIEIDTDEKYRRKGLALVSASALILECLNRGLYPSWDAANKDSVALAEKLGYHFDHEYVTYAITKFR